MEKVASFNALFVLLSDARQSYKCTRNDTRCMHVHPVLFLSPTLRVGLAREVTPNNFMRIASNARIVILLRLEYSFLQIHKERERVVFEFELQPK